MKHDEVNRNIRAAAGRVDPREIAAAAIAAAERAGDASALRERIATEAGLPVALAARLQGTDAAELADDAKALADTLAEMRPTPAAPEDFNTQIRRAAGHRPDGEERSSQ